MDRLMKSLASWFNSDFWMGLVSTAVAWVVHTIAPIAPFLIMAVLLTGGNALTAMVGRVQAQKDVLQPAAKVLMYLVAIALAEGMRLVFAGFDWLPYAVAVGICVREFVRVLGNVEHGMGEGLFAHIVRMLTGGKRDEK
jgi:hypothetical protein